MKNLIGALLLVLITVGCSSKANKPDDTSSETMLMTTDTTGVAPLENTTEKSEPEQMYACSMHPEVKGKKGDKCSKCGMDLSVPVN